VGIRYTGLTFCIINFRSSDVKPAHLARARAPTTCLRHSHLMCDRTQFIISRLRAGSILDHQRRCLSDSVIPRIPVGRFFYFQLLTLLRVGTRAVSRGVGHRAQSWFLDAGFSASFRQKPASPFALSTLFLQMLRRVGHSYYGDPACVSIRPRAGHDTTGHPTPICGSSILSARSAWITRSTIGGSANHNISQSRKRNAPALTR
jgi:hypothetical protein